VNPFFVAVNGLSQELSYDIRTDTDRREELPFALSRASHCSIAPVGARWIRLT
jgi:hypothetical protein